MSDSCLLLIDIQNDNGLTGEIVPEVAAAAQKAKLALAAARERGMPIVHVRHENLEPDATAFLPETFGSRIHESVAPVPGETVVIKHYPNSFRETGLAELLRGLGVEHAHVAGMMSYMCIDATVRAGWDLGFVFTLLHDACAGRALVHEGKEIPAAMVHGAYMAALGRVFAKLMRVEDFVSGA